ncbi:MAG: hypothetical protein JXQ83_11320, partial [Candidatus Glassbacteria bacterium]|nr:hypothetical protein [Candidatus Glassbacteria bacterium]
APQAAEPSAAPAGLSAAADTTAGAADSTSAPQAAEPSAAPAGLSTAADTTAGAADSASVLRTADSLAVPAKPKAAADTTAKPKAAADTTAKPQKKVRPPGDRVIAEIIPWDWDEYTNVIEVGLRRDDGREYSLTKNEFYQTVFDNLRLKVLAIGKVTSDPEGFYEMTVEYLEPADSTQSLAAKKSRRP